MPDLLDPVAVAQLRELMGEDFPALVAAFLSDSAIRMKDIEAAVTANDHERLRRAAHSLNGMCLNMGARRLANSLAALESAALHSQDSSAVAPFWKTVCDEYPLVRSAATAAMA